MTDSLGAVDTKLQVKARILDRSKQGLSLSNIARGAIIPLYKSSVNESNPRIVNLDSNIIGAIRITF